jgi:RHS repeat-associated protein
MINLIIISNTCFSHICIGLSMLCIHDNQRQIVDIGLYYYGSRFYSPSLGKFIQPDTMVPAPYNPQYLNRYSYVDNNPIRYNDPSGHRIEEGTGYVAPKPTTNRSNYMPRHQNLCNLTHRVHQVRHLLHMAVLLFLH